MRKIVTLQLWVDDDWAKNGDKYYMNDDLIRSDIQTELSCCWHNFEIIKFETMEIQNEKAIAHAAGNLSGYGAR